MRRAGEAPVARRRLNLLLACPLIFGVGVVLAALAGQDTPIQADAASAVSATPVAAAVPGPNGPAGSPAGADPVRDAPAGASPAGANPTSVSVAAANPIPPAGGHGAGTNPELVPDLRPYRDAGIRDNPPVPGKPFFNPDPLNPVFDRFQGPLRENNQEPDQSLGPERAFTEAERRQLVAEGKDLFFSTTAFGQRPSLGPLVLGEFLSCASCHSGPGFSDGRTHLISPVREREFGHRQTPSLFGVVGTAPFGWDGRNATLQNQARGAIVSPLEMNASREPTRRELDALAEFQKTLVPPPARPGIDFDPAKARRGEQLFRTPRLVIDPSGEFGPGEKVACATCHSGPFFTDGQFHRIALPTFFTGDPTFDPGMVDEEGNIRGFATPSLLGARFTSPFFHDGIAGDPTAPSNLLGGGLGAGALDGDIGATGPPAARRALLNNVLPFYNNIRFNFGFTQEELTDLAEFVLSL
jgi:cytochrome c peroxidase